MIIKLKLSKTSLNDFNYIDDRSNIKVKTHIIKELIKKEAHRLRLLNGDAVPETNYGRVAKCHPDRKHYSKGYCRPCYVKDRYK